MHLNLSYMIHNTYSIEKELKKRVELLAVVLEYLNDLYIASGLGHPEDFLE